MNPSVPSGRTDIVTSMAMEYASHMSPQTSAFNTPPKFVRVYNGKDPYKNGSRIPLSAGTTSLGRPSSGRREFMSSFNTTSTAGVSPGAVAVLSELKRVHVGMRKDDRICPDCDGFVWSSKSECESDKCHRKRQDKTASKTECESDECQRDRQDKPASVYVEDSKQSHVS